jgi:glycosyltransferase involved in cell wall biosynthesis
MYPTIGGMLAFEPVVREIEHFALLFSEITWIGYQYPGSPPGNTRKINPEIPITFVPLKACGGPRIKDKLTVILRAPGIGIAVWKALAGVEVVHSRAPSMPAFWAILFSAFDRSRRYWHKYAGDWTSIRVPFFYGLQRWMLQHIPHVRVTMNGSFRPENPHCLAWVNPCISNDELAKAAISAGRKDYCAPLNICFAGHLTASKGIIQLIEAVASLPETIVHRLFIAGDGPLLDAARRAAGSAGIHRFEFLGNLPRRRLEAIYEKSHILVLPSASEGFPKVIPEACAFGCVPLVSAVPALLPFFRGEMQKLILEDCSAQTIARAIARLAGDREQLRSLSSLCVACSAAFTYERYVARIQREILDEDL